MTPERLQEIRALADTEISLCDPADNAIAELLDALDAQARRIAQIDRVAACATADAFLALPDVDKRLWFALAIDDSERRKQAEARLAEMEADAQWRQKWHAKLGRGAEPEGRFYERIAAARNRALCDAVNAVLECGDGSCCAQKHAEAIRKLMGGVTRMDSLYSVMAMAEIAIWRQRHFRFLRLPFVAWRVKQYEREWRKTFSYRSAVAACIATLVTSIASEPALDSALRFAPFNCPTCKTELPEPKEWRNGDYGLDGDVACASCGDTWTITRCWPRCGPNF